VSRGNDRPPTKAGVKGAPGGVTGMGDLVYLLIVFVFFAAAIGYARIAPRL
jgi:hypothetical protein